MKTTTNSMTRATILLCAALASTLGACAMDQGEDTESSAGDLSGPATLLVSLSSARSSPQALQGATLATGASLYIFTSDGTKSANPSGISQVSYWLDDTAMTGAATHVEKAAPYDYVGTADDGSAEALASLGAGTHTITQAVTPTSGSVQVATATFTIGKAATGYTLLVSASASHASPTALDGATLSGSEYIFTSDATKSASPAGITQVRYWLDNTAMSGSPTHIESAAPYDFIGSDGADGEAWVTNGIAAGTHTVTQSVTTTTGGVQNSTATFKIGSSSGGGGTTGGSGACSPTATSPGGAGAANIAGSNIPAYPKLTSAFTVTGLDGSGGADVGTIIQNALSSHSQVIIPGSGSFSSPLKYKVSTPIKVPAGVIIECEEGAEFLDPVACTDSQGGLFTWNNETASVTGAGMYGCMFKGTASAINVPTSFAHVFVRLQSAHNFTLEGNITNNSCGDADLRVDGPENSASDHGSTGNLLAFNDMENAENGIAIINGWSNTVKCNTAFNGGLVDEEPNSPIAQVGDNTITKNYMAMTHDTPGTYWMGFSIGGNGTNCPAGSGICAKDTVTDNVINSGGFTQPMRIYCECNSAGNACDNSKFGGTWSGNIVTGGSSCRCGDACSD